MKIFLIMIFVSSILIGGIIGMSEKQLAAAIKMVKNVCQPKTKAVDEDIIKMHQGDWNIDHTAMCYMQCVLNMYKLIFVTLLTAYRILSRKNLSFLTRPSIASLVLLRDVEKDNTFNYDSAMAQLKQVPDRYKESTEKCTNQCRDSAVTLDDKCIAAYEIAKCIYFCSPENYYLP